MAKSIDHLYTKPPHAGAQFHATVEQDEWREPDAVIRAAFGDKDLPDGTLLTLVREEDEHPTVWIYTVNIENDLKQNRWISQAVMHGDRRPYPVVLVTLDPEEAPALAKELGIENADPAALAEDPKVHERIQGILDEVNRNYAQVEQGKPTKVTILDEFGGRI